MTARFTAQRMERLGSSEPSDPRRALKNLLGAVAREIDTLTAQGHRLQGVISAHVGAAGQAEQAVEDAQLIDHLLQHVEALGQVLQQVAEQTPAGIEVELETLLKALPLEGLARRLSGEEQEDAGPSSGDLDLF